MARATLTKIPVKGPFPGTVGANALDASLTAATVSPDFNQFLPSGNDVLLVYNSGVTSHNLTLTSVADSHGRKGDITSYSIGASELAVFHFDARSVDGWVQSDGYIYVDADHAELKLAVLQL